MPPTSNNGITHTLNSHLLRRQTFPLARLLNGSAVLCLLLLMIILLIGGTSASALASSLANTAASPSTASSHQRIGQADLIIESLTIDAITVSRIDYSYTVKNIGTASANTSSVSIQAFLSNDTVFNNRGDVAAGGRILHIPNLAAGASHLGSFGATTTVDPNTMTYLAMKVDWGESIDEASERNNTIAVPIQDDGCSTGFPAPQLTFQGHEVYSTASGTFVRYQLDVPNNDSYDDELFAAAPDLPACGSNTNSSRTWVNIYDNSDSYVYGFCGFSQASSLNSIWFAKPLEEAPPENVYIELVDRRCDKTYRSESLAIPAYEAPKPDLIVESLAVDSFTADSISYSYTIKNVGEGAANLDGPTDSNSDNVSVQAFLSDDTVFNNRGDVAAGGTILGVSPLGMLNPGETFSGSFSASPAVDPATMAYLTLKIDWGESTEESDEDNNTLAVLIQPECGTTYPTPELQFRAHELYSTEAGTFVRYRMTVDNRAAYPDELFASAPDLPACGLNTNASRTWVDIFDNDDARLYGFCAFNEAENLDLLWFAESLGDPAPPSVYIELNDRQCGNTYRSNTVSIPPYEASTATDTPTPTHTPTHTPTATPTNTPTPTLTPTPTEPPVQVDTPTPTSTPTHTPTPTNTPDNDLGGQVEAVPDEFEGDNDCAEAKTLEMNALPDHHTFHARGDADWVKFDATAESTYRIEVQIPAASLADVTLELYKECSSEPDEGGDNELAPGIRLDFAADQTGPVYLKLANFDPNISGEDVTYQVSVRELQAATSTDSGGLIILAGRLRINDRLQTNIHNVAEEVYSLFRASGYDDSHIEFLTTDDSIPGHDKPATTANFENAIVNWAKDKVGSEKLLTIYMIDHGDQDTFYIDEPNGQRVTPDQLDGWLDQLEAAVPDIRINIFIEACNSGSFISGLSSVSSAKRVIVTSTNALNVAYASENGAHFSDHFFSALQQGHHIFGGYWEANESVKRSHGLQRPQIDGDGNGLPNEDTDFLIASQRSFFISSTPVESNVWPPYIEQFSELSSISDDQVTLRAQIRDDLPNIKAWAVIYPPTYTPPANSSELVPETLEKVDLTVGSGDLFQGIYSNLSTPGQYRIVVHAEDQNGLRARPASLNFSIGTQTFLPFVSN
ncbi:MAG: CARDB domain-containing protein [Chloroflexota bacterium]